MGRRLAMIATAIAVVLAAAAPAAAAQLSVDNRCYIPSEPVKLTGAGFTPNGQVDIQYYGETVATVTADAAGNAVYETPAPLHPEGPTVFEPIAVGLAAVDRADPAVRASVEFSITNLLVGMRPSVRKVRPRSRMQLVGTGFSPSRPVYLHYVYRGRERKRARVATARTECGTWRVTVRRWHVRAPRRGVWRLQLDHERTYSATTPGGQYFEIRVR